MSKMILIALALILAAPLTGCGQKGKLYLPEEQQSR
ncbi:MAG: lipopeptide [Gammaproteobacteria bacterium]|nr:MAG: lipopeptide [Gammaproteobacteria bacterium]